MPSVAEIPLIYYYSSRLVRTSPPCGPDIVCLIIVDIRIVLRYSVTNRLMYLTFDFLLCTGTACSISCMANWLFAFFVTKFFSSLVSVIHIYNTFWLFTLFSVLGTFFVIFVVPETKGKSMDEIQEMLGAGNDLTPTSRVNHTPIDTKEKF